MQPLGDAADLECWPARAVASWPTTVGRSSDPRGPGPARSGWQDLDTYEYVGGRPQLLTSGQGSVDHTGGEILSLFLPPEDIGLKAVSHNGTDATSRPSKPCSEKTTMAQPSSSTSPHRRWLRHAGEPAPCAAADECHNAGSAPPPAPVIGTGVDGATRQRQGGKEEEAEGQEGEEAQEGREAQEG